MARDHAVHQMESLCASNRSKESVIAKLQREKAELEHKLASTAKIPGIIKVDLGNNKQDIEQECRKLEQENNMLKVKLESFLQQRENMSSPRFDVTTRTPSMDAKVCAHLTDLGDIGV